MSKDVEEPVDKGAATGRAAASAQRPTDKPKESSQAAKARRGAPTTSKQQLPSWWPKSGLIAVGGCLVVRLDGERYREIVATEKEIGLPIAELAGSAVAAAVTFLSDEVAREAERLRPLIRSIDEEDERLANELNERKAARLERARLLLARNAETGPPN